MRKLPIYFYVDTSVQMNDILPLVKKDISEKLTCWSNKPCATELYEISFFNENDYTRVTLSNNAIDKEFTLPICDRAQNAKVPPSGILKNIAKNIENQTYKATTESKGDYAPILFFYTSEFSTSELCSLFNMIQHTRIKQLLLFTPYMMKSGTCLCFDSHTSGLNFNIESKGTKMYYCYDYDAEPKTTKYSTSISILFSYCRPEIPLNL